MLCVFILFSESFKSTTTMMRAHTEYNGIAHTRDGSVDLFIVVVGRITLFTVNFKSISRMMRAHTEGQP